MAKTYVCGMGLGGKFGLCLHRPKNRFQILMCTTGSTAQQSTDACTQDVLHCAAGGAMGTGCNGNMVQWEHGNMVQWE